MKLRLFFLYACTLVPLFLKAQCSADFNFQQDPCSPTTVAFSAVLPAVQSFVWDFGNSTSNNSTLNPLVSYTSYGNYSVSLTVTYTNGCTFTKTRLVPVIVLQDNSLISTPDSMICAGDNILLHSTGTAANFCWHSASATLSTTSQDITVTPTVPTVYYYSAQAQTGEAVTNGDFSNGNTGFTTDYSYCNSFQCIGEGNYSIGPDAQFYHFDFRGFDHTTGTGNFLMANGMLTANANVWCQSVTVTPNTNYDFSMWICTVAGEYAPAELQLRINGVPVGAVATAPSTIYTWTQHTTTWNSGSSTTADLCIVTVSDWFGGNDFGIDDISFGSPSTSMLIDSVFINVQSPATANISYASPLCSSLSSVQPVLLTGSGAFTGGTFSAGSGLSINPATGAILPSASTPGNYTVTYTTPDLGGCPAVSATAVISIISATTSTSTITICNNQLPYTWNGNSYSTAGAYSVTLTSSAGCDSIATLNLTVNNTLSSTTNATICNSQLPFTWNGNSYSTAGIYSVTLTSSAGCDSIATLNLTVNNTLSSTTSITICNSQLPYTWNGNSYSAAGTYSVTLTNSAGCDSIATLNLTVNNTLSSTTNTTICNSQLPYTWNGNSYSTAGTYSVTLTSSAGCDSIATLNLTVNNTLSSTTNTTICNTQLPYSWNGNSYSTAGTYSVTLTSSAGCDSIATLNLTVNNTPSSTTNTTICNSQLPYSWNGNNYPAAGIFSITLISSAGCDSIATLILTVIPSPIAPAATTPVNYCQDEGTSALSASASGAGSQLLWYNSATGGTASTVAPVPSSSVAGTTIYYVSQLNGSCEGPRSAITVTVNSVPGYEDQLVKICAGQAANIGALYDTTGLSFTWTSGQQPLTDLSAVHDAGFYQLVVITAAGCADTAIVNLIINEPVIANAGNDSIVEYGVPYQLSGSGGLQYQWWPNTDLTNPFISTPIVTLTHDESFILMAMDDIGCFDLDTVHFRVLKGPTFYIPSAFSPNADGINDVFRPTAAGISSLEYFRIFNRWGQLVFQTHKINHGWDGNYKGVKQPIGNYVWDLKGTDRKGTTKVMKGNVMLIR